MASNNNYLTQKDDDVIKVLSELKAIGVKVPKLRKVMATKSKQEINISENGCKIFGSSLYEQEWTTSGENPLPEFLVMATEYLQKFIKQEGLFRKAGNIARQRNLKAKIERRESFQDANPNDVACLLKQWLRDLKEPLIPFYLQKLFIRCTCLAVENDRVSACLLTILLLPPENQHTLKHIVRFLSSISMNSDKNKMDIHNLAIIMAPNIFATNKSSEKTNNLLNHHTAILELLIENSDKIDEVPKFNRTLLGANLQVSVETLDSKSMKNKRKPSGPVQDIFFGFKKLVGQTGSPLTSKSSSEDNFKTPKNLKPAMKRKLDPDELPLKTTENKKQTLSYENSDSLKLSRPNEKEAVTKVEKRKDSRPHRKSFGALFLRQKRRKRPEEENPLLATDLLAAELDCGKGLHSYENYNYSMTLTDINSNFRNPISLFSKKEKDMSNSIVNPTENTHREIYTKPFNSEYKPLVEHSKNSNMCVENESDTFKTPLPPKTPYSAPNISETACKKYDAQNITQILDFSLKLLIQNCKSPPKESSKLGTNFLSNKNNPEFKVNISKIENPAPDTEVRTSTNETFQTPENSRTKIKVRSSCHSGSKIPRLKHLHTPNRQSSFSGRVTPNRRRTRQLNGNSDNISSKIPIMQMKCEPAKEEFLEVQNDSFYGTPNSSLTSWMDDTQYLSVLSSPDDEIVHKRESIAKILKENPGHVQAKISLYDKNSSSSSGTKSESL